MKLIALGAVTLALSVCLPAAEHSDTYQRTFQVSGADRKLIIENINGNIVVTGDSGNDIRVTVREHWKADTQEQLDSARRDMRLEMQQTGNTVRLFLDGPFRDRDRQSRREYRHLEFNHEFQVQVPKDIVLELKTINGGEVRAEHTRGEFHLRNINGSVRLTDASGFGEAETINGGVHVSFVENPAGPSRFKSLNGIVAVAFQPNLSADLRLKSLNGDAYTDFDFANAPASTTIERGAGRVRLDRNRVVRIGSGGLEHSFETLNGNIKITKYGK